MGRARRFRTRPDLGRHDQRLHTSILKWARGQPNRVAVPTGISSPRRILKSYSIRPPTNGQSFTPLPRATVQVTTMSLGRIVGWDRRENGSSMLRSWREWVGLPVPRGRTGPTRVFGSGCAARIGYPTPAATKTSGSPSALSPRTEPTCGGRSLRGSPRDTLKSPESSGIASGTASGIAVAWPHGSPHEVELPPLERGRPLESRRWFEPKGPPPFPWPAPGESTRRRVSSSRAGPNHRTQGQRLTLCHSSS